MPDDLTDDDREAAVAHLRDHAKAGRLTLAEFDDRVAAALAATTGGDLRYALRELPLDPSPPAGVGGYIGLMRNEIGSWVGLNFVCNGIYLATGGGGYWPVWPLVISTGGLLAFLIRGPEGEAERQRKKAAKEAAEREKQRKTP